MLEHNQPNSYLKSNNSFATNVWMQAQPCVRSADLILRTIDIQAIIIRFGLLPNVANTLQIVRSTHFRSMSQVVMIF